MPEDQIEKIKALKTDYINTFTGEHGKKVLEDLENRCFIEKTSFTGEALTSAFNEGTRSVVNHIKSMMKYDTDKLKELREEGQP